MQLFCSYKPKAGAGVFFVHTAAGTAYCFPGVWVGFFMLFESVCFCQCQVYIKTAGEQQGSQVMDQFED